MAIAAAERGHAVPPQLLAAIGRVESGRRDPGTGAWGAWPWTINAEGQGAYFETKAEVIRAVQALQARGVRSIDVGCMQVNLMHHPTAFPNLDMAFEPSVNADYAARFLVQLHDQTGDWVRATANYHSANPDEGGPYAAKVTSIWPEEQRKAGSAPPVPFASGRVGPFTMAVPPFPGRQPARLFAMAGMPPVMVPQGMVPSGMLPPGSPGMLPAGMGVPGGGLPGTTPFGKASVGTGASGMVAIAAGFGQPAAMPGHTLDFYRSTPIRTVPMPRLLARPMFIVAR